MKNRFAIVTGATKGIGAAVAKKMLEQGHNVIGCYSSDDEAAIHLQNDVKSYKGNFELIKVDLSSYSGIESFVTYLINKAQNERFLFDWIVMNAAQTDRSTFRDINEKAWKRVFNVNLNAPFFILQGIDDLICENGRIVFLGAVMGQLPHAMSISYAASKAALHQLAKNLVKEYAARNITINVVAPGFVDTPWQITKDKEHRKRIEGKIAMGRFATADEVADLCMSTISNGYINGAILNIDGGYDYK